MNGIFLFLSQCAATEASKASSGGDPTSSNSDRESDFAPVSGSIARSTDNAIQGAHDNVSIDTDLRGGIATRKGDSST